MDAKANEETMEAKTMRKHYADLTQTIQDPLRLAAKLYSENVIARNVLDSTIESTCTKVEKTMQLLQAVSDQIAINPKDFHCFLIVLKKDSSLQAAAELINSTYSRLIQGDSNNTEQENDESIMYPKRPRLSTQEQEYTSIKMKCQNIQLSWKQCLPLPETIAGGTAVVIGNKVYVNPGLYSNYRAMSASSSSKIYEYEILENVWSNEIECPRTHFTLAVIDGLITLVGGGTTLPGSTFVFGVNTLLSLVDNQSIAGTKQWSEYYKPMQIKRRNPATAYNSRYFIVAGSDLAFDISTVEVMDLSTKEWFSPSTLPKNDGYIHSATIIGDHLYLTYGHKSVRFCCPVVTCSLTALVKSCESATIQSIVRPLLWQKLPQGPPLYRPRTVELCGNLLAIGGYMTLDFNNRKDKEMYECQGSVYVYDEGNGKWILVCRLPSDNGFPDNAYSVARLSENKIIVMGGAQFSDDQGESFPDTDVVHIGSIK